MTTKWKEYKACPTCRVAQGQPCEHMILLTTKGNPVYLSVPHSKRKKVTK